MSWDKYFIEMLPYIASKSKDTSTKVGAIITDVNHIIVATGFNGFPRGVDETKKSRFERPTKYSFTEHCERNAIYAAARKGISLENCLIYISWLPCTDCARAIIQVGISDIIIDGRNYEKDLIYWDERWKDDMVISVDMLREAGVAIWIWKPEHYANLFDYRRAGDIKWRKGKDTGITQKQT